MSPCRQRTLALDSRERLHVFIRAERVEKCGDTLLAQNAQRGACAGNTIRRGRLVEQRPDRILPGILEKSRGLSRGLPSDATANRVMGLRRDLAQLQRLGVGLIDGHMHPGQCLRHSAGLIYRVDRAVFRYNLRCWRERLDALAGCRRQTESHTADAAQARIVW